MIMKNLLTLSHINKTFFNDQGENKVLNDITLEINENEIVALLGPSGCGKSTILNIIASLENYSEGKMILNAKLGYMFQKDNLLPWRTIFDNVCLGLEIQKKNTIENKNYVKTLLQKYDLLDYINHYPHELSGGMRQRVSLIRTLALKPDLLLLDEPFSALDAQTKLTVQNDVYSIIKNEKKSALIVTHDISEAIALSDKIIILTIKPATIKKVIDIKFNNLSPLKRRKDTLFTDYYNKICEELEIK